MSNYKFSCPHCEQHLSGTTEWAGRNLPCPKCGKEFTAPEAATPTQTPPPLPAQTGLRLSQGSTHRASGDLPPVIASGSDLEQQILSGGRFVIYQYCLSFLILSFRRSSSPTYLAPGKDGAGGAFGHSLISLLFGWWGIPWGPIWTISTIYRNLRGGVDVTQEVLAQQLGPGRAAQILARRQIVPCSRSGLRALRWGFGAAAALFLMVIFLPFVVIAISPRSSSSKSGSRLSSTARAQMPGAASFENANRQLGVNNGEVGFGNSTQAKAVATAFSMRMKAIRESEFEGGKKNGLSVTKHEFLTHCELQEGKCAILVHVPELRRYNREAKAALGELAWAAAQGALLKEGAARPGQQLAVALRGVALYDRVITGSVMKSPGGLGQPTVATGPGCESAIYNYFTPSAGPTPAVTTSTSQR